MGNMSMSVPFPLFFLMSMQVFHIMVMILMCGIQHHIKIAHIQPRFFYAGYLYLISIHRQTFQSLS